MSKTHSFEQYMNDWQSWHLIFARAPINVVSDAYGTIEGRAISHDVAVKAQKSEKFGPDGHVVQVRDSDWTVILHRVGRWESFDSSGLAKKLSAPVLSFEGEDTSGAVECRLFDAEGVGKRYQTSDDAEYEGELYDEVIEHAQKTGQEVKQPKQDVLVDSYDSLFASLGVVPVMVTKNEKGVVLAKPEDWERIARVDHVED